MYQAFQWGKDMQSSGCHMCQSLLHDVTKNVPVSWPRDTFFQIIWTACAMPIIWPKHLHSWQMTGCIPWWTAFGHMRKVFPTALQRIVRALGKSDYKTNSYACNQLATHLKSHTWRVPRSNGSDNFFFWARSCHDPQTVAKDVMDLLSLRHVPYCPSFSVYTSSYVIS